MTVGQLLRHPPFAAIVFASALALTLVFVFAGSGHAGSPSPVITSIRVPGANGHTFTTTAFRVDVDGDSYLCVVTEDSANDHSSGTNNRPASLALAQSCDFSVSR